MVAYLDQPSVADRALNAARPSLLTPMITESDNDAAHDRVRHRRATGAPSARPPRGHDALRHLARSGARRRSRRPTRRKFFLHIDSYIAAAPPRLRDDAARRRSCPRSAGASARSRRGAGSSYFKGGWGYGTGLLDHQVALLVRGCARVSIAVLTMYDGSHAVRQGHAEGHLRAAAPRASDRQPAHERPKHRSIHRGARIRTGDLRHPKAARYQAALRPDAARRV